MKNGAVVHEGRLGRIFLDEWRRALNAWPIEDQPHAAYRGDLMADISDSSGSIYNKLHLLRVVRIER
jgi:hypothetical protein